MPIPVLWSGSIFPGESTHERIGPAGTALISARPQWSGLFVFLVAAFEAIVLAGKIIPAAVSGLAAWREDKGADAANPPADLGRCLKRPVQLPLTPCDKGIFNEGSRKVSINVLALSPRTRQRPGTYVSANAEP